MVRLRLRVVEEQLDWTESILSDLEIGINDLQHLRSPVVVPCKLWGRRVASGCCPTIGPTVMADTFSPFCLSILRVDKQAPGSVLGAGAKPFIKVGKHSHRVNLFAAVFEAMKPCKESARTQSLQSLKRAGCTRELVRSTADCLNDGTYRITRHIHLKEHPRHLRSQLSERTTIGGPLVTMLISRATDRKNRQVRGLPGDRHETFAGRFAD